tara:strand:+ start:174 stop:629 length:456 start_codon:yes stop_codon:yes gene_type:complete
METISEEKENFSDPENTPQIIEEIKNSETHDEVVDIINKTFPKWILGWPKRYSVDYPHFQNNWNFVCKKAECKPLSVIIVDTIEFKKPNYSLVRFFSELLTVFGHSVRRKEEFIGCKICGDAIPNQTVYNQLVERKVPNIPSCWMIKCKNC